MVEELSDVRIKIGRQGWDWFKSKGNRNHEFNDTLNKGAFQYSSNYGIIDVGPVWDSLHERTLWAIGNQNNFLTGSGWNEHKYLPNDYSGLFFNGTSGHLRERVERIMENPTAHRERSRQFGVDYTSAYSAQSFLQTLDKLTDEIRSGYNQENIA